MSFFTRFGLRRAFDCMAVGHLDPASTPVPVSFSHVSPQRLGRFGVCRAGPDIPGAKGPLKLSSPG